MRRFGELRLRTGGLRIGFCMSITIEHPRPVAGMNTVT